MNTNYGNDAQSEVLSSARNVLSEAISRAPQEIYDEVPAENYQTGIGIDSSGPSLRNINIRPLNSGYIVEVGCQSVAIETTEKLIEVLNLYLTDPAEFETKWYSNNKVRNKLENVLK